MKGKTILAMIAVLLIGALFPVFLANVHAITCPSPCSLIVLTNVPSSDASVTVTAKGFPSPLALNHTYTYANGTVNWVQVTSTNITGSSGARYIFKQWDLNTIQGWSSVANSTALPLMIQNYTVTAVYEKLLPLTLSFTGPSGQPVSPPTSLTLQSTFGSATLTPGQYSNHWMNAAVWTVASATWQGVQETLGTQTIDLTSIAVAASVMIQAYDAQIQLINNFNSPITGASVTVTLTNGTKTYTFTSDAQGYVDLGLLPPGTYNAHVVYQNRDYGSYVVDPTVNPVDTIRLDATPPTIGTPSLSPSTPGSNDTVTVAVAVSDPTGVASVLIVYTTDNWNLVNSTVLAPYNAAFDDYRAVIPEQPQGSHVSFYVVALNVGGNRAVNNNSGSFFSYNIHSYIVTGLSQGNTYTFTVRAQDSTGNQSNAGLSQIETMPIQQPLQQYSYVLLVGIVGAIALGALAFTISRRRRNIP